MRLKVPEVVAVAVLLSLTFVTAQRRSTTHALDRRITRLERLVYEDSMEFRDKIHSISSALIELSQNNSAEQTCGCNDMPHPTMDIPTRSQNDDDAKNDAAVFVQAIHDEKSYVRRSIQENQMENERNLHRIGQIESVINMTADRLTATEIEFSNNITTCNQELTILQETVEIMNFEINDLKHRLTARETKFSNELTVRNQEINTLRQNVATMNFEINDLKQKYASLTQKSCGKWQRLRNSCYMFFKDRETWDKAKSRCISLDAYLVELDDEEEDRFVISIIPEDTYDGPWTGGSDQNVEGEWKWTYSGRVVGEKYSQWGRNEPNGGRSENCLHFYTYENVWNDTPCDRETTFVCEK